MKENTRGKIAIIFSALIWSAGFLLVRLWDSMGYSVPTFLFANFVFSTIIFFGIVKYKKLKLVPDKQSLKLLVFMGVIATGTALTFIWALILTKIAIAEFLHYTMPLWAFLIAVFWLKEKITKWKFFALILAVIGIIFVFDLDIFFNNFNLVSLGSLLALVSAVFYAITVNVGRKLEKVSHYVTSFWTMAIGMVIVFFYFIFSNTFKGWWDIPIFLGYALVTSVIPNSLFFYGLRKVEATTSSILMLVEVPLASLWAWILFSEGLSALNIMGGVFILVSTIILIKRHKNKESGLG